ncbi:hypothetical protein DVH05_027432 [Phytophthora capsici]|nr:hypothetical protein DVH05_027432 [Phytophthora capsici]
MASLHLVGQSTLCLTVKVDQEAPLQSQYQRRTSAVRSVTPSISPISVRARRDREESRARTQELLLLIGALTKKA